MFHFSTALKNIRRTPYQALAATSVMVLTFFALSVFLMVSFGSVKLLEFFEGKPQITVFFLDEANREEIASLESELEASGKMKTKRFVSKDEALEIYREQNKEDPILLELVTAEILPASLEISASSPEDLAHLADIVSGSPLVEEVVYQADLIAELTAWTKAIRTFGFIIVGYLSLVSFLVMLVVIGMKVSARREEIEILRLVGATDWFIRAPFIIEGFIYGVFSALMAWLFSLVGLWQALPYLSVFLSGTGLIPVNPIWTLYLLGLLLLGGMLVGGAGSFLTVWRYLR